jgi:hypothetical protein
MDVYPLPTVKLWHKTVAPPKEERRQPSPAISPLPRNFRARLPWLLGAGFCVASVPQTAFANAGTPLMWATMLHLAIGNALIGVFEGLLLAWLFSLKKAKAVGLLIAANYVSAWAGGLLLRAVVVPHLHIHLNNGWRWFWVMVVTTYLLTLVMEWPFVALPLRDRADWLRASVRGNLIVQTASYGLIFGWYWLASGTSLYTKFEVVSPRELSLPETDTNLPARRKATGPLCLPRSGT